MADGSIVIDTEVNNKKAQAELNRLGNKINKLNEALSGNKGKQSAIKTELEGAKKEALKTEQTIKKLKAELSETYAITSGQVKATPNEFIDATVRQPEITQQLQEQEALLKQQDKETQRLDAQYAKITDTVIRQSDELSRAKSEADRYTAKLAKTPAAVQKLGPAMESAQKSARRFGLRIREVVRSALVFTLITQALAKFREWMGKVIKSNAEASAAVAKLKGALLTLAQPLVEVIIPAFTAFVNILAKVVSAIASVLASIFGTTIEDSAQAAENMYEEQNAIEGVGNAAKKASKSLASFDEINKLSSGSTSGGSNNASSGSIAPDFSLPNLGEKELENILTLVSLIAGALLTWRLSSAFHLGLNQALSLFLSIQGAILLASGLLDVFANGANWKNLTKILSGAALLIGGLYLAFGSLAAGIAAVISGVLMLATGFYDVIHSGATLQNTLLIIAGIIATGLGIALLTGSLIPLLISAILGVIYAIVAWQGNAEELAKNLKLVFGGIIDFLVGVFTGDWERAWNGLKDIVKGVLNSVVIIFESLLNGIISGLNWLISQLNKLSFDVPDGMGGVIHMGINIPKIPKVELPRLATGAVIPPNREFLAVLGDQKSGTNIEAPLATIEQALFNALSRAGYGGQGEAVLEVDGQQFGKLIYRYGNKENRRIGVSLVGR